MASAARALRLGCRSCRIQRRAPTLGPRVFVAWKSVSGGGGSFKDDAAVADTREHKASPFDQWEAEALEEDLKYRDLLPTQVIKRMAEDEEGGRDAAQALRSGLGAISDDALSKVLDDLREDARPLRTLVKPKRDAFWDDEEPDNDLITNDDSDTFNEDDITDLAHAKLEEIREQREYARLAIWEMPLLAKYAKPFEPPTMEQPLRFRYTSYMGEFHPAEKKVVVEFSPSDMPLTEVQQDKMRKLAGARYNPDKDVIKISCESFEHQAQNKRHLAETVQKLIAEAEDPSDSFADVPLDLRHHKPKVKPKFPVEWRLSEERMQELEARRKEILQLEEAKKAQGTFVDGVEVINKAVARRMSNMASPEMVPAMRSAQRARKSASF